MPKFEYDNISKFLVSLGIFVLLIPFIFAWAWLKTPFDLTIEKSKIQKLTPLAQQIINDRQSIIGVFTDVFPYMFIILIIVGCSIIWVGISSWNRRQKLLDDHQILTNKKLEMEIAPSVELGEKVNKEIEQIANEFPDSPPPTIDSYIAVESLVNDNVNRLFSDKFYIFTNKRLGQYEYDVIMQGKSKLTKDYIIEVKYYKRISSDLLTKAMNHIMGKSKYYIDLTNAIPMSVLFMVAIDSATKEKIERLIFEYKASNPKSKLKFIVIERSDLESLDDKILTSIIG
jgi:uncharacterized membrane protein YidH (DUF202 family)